jgi:hypothetical protein
MSGKSPLDLGAIAWWNAAQGWDATNHVWTDTINSHTLTESFGSGTIGTATHVAQSNLNGQTSIYVAAGNAYGLRSANAAPWTTLLNGDFTILVIQEADPNTTPETGITNFFSLGSWTAGEQNLTMHFDGTNMYKGVYTNNSVSSGGITSATTLSQRSFIACTSRQVDRLVTVYESGITYSTLIGALTLNSLTNARLLIGNATTANNQHRGYGFHNYHIAIFNKRLTQEDVEDLKFYFAKTPDELNTNAGGLISWYDASQGWNDTTKVWTPRSGSSANTLTELNSSTTPRPVATTKAGRAAVTTFGSLVSPVGAPYSTALANNATLFFDGGISSFSNTAGISGYLALGDFTSGEPAWYQYFQHSTGNWNSMFQSYDVSNPILGQATSVVPPFNVFGISSKVDGYGRIVTRASNLQYIEGFNSGYNSTIRSALNLTNVRLRVGCGNTHAGEDAVLDLYNLVFFNRPLSNWEMDQLIFWSELNALELSPYQLGAKAWWDANFNWNTQNKTWTDKISSQSLSSVNYLTTNTATTISDSGQQCVSIPTGDVNSTLYFNNGAFLSQFNTNLGIVVCGEKTNNSNAVVLSDNNTSGLNPKVKMVGINNTNNFLYATEATLNVSTPVQYSVNETVSNPSFYEALYCTGSSSSFFTHFHQKQSSTDFTFTPTFMHVGDVWWDNATNSKGGKFNHIVLFDKTLNTQENRSLNKFLRRFGVKSTALYGSPSLNWNALVNTGLSILSGTYDNSKTAKITANTDVKFASVEDNQNSGSISKPKRLFNPGFNKGSG